MYQVMTADEAVGLVQDGDIIGVNAFLAIANPTELHAALSRRVERGNGPRGLTVFCSAGFGDWTEDSPIEGYIRGGAVSKVILGHLGSMPSTARMVGENQIKGYNLPLGVMSHMIRAGARGESFHLSQVGVNLFVDPTVEGCRLNDISNERMVERVSVRGKDMLLYEIPRSNVAFIKGTSADQQGNISFEKECATVDALALAQMVHRNGGKVIVQVERRISEHLRPRNVIVPGILVDALVVCPEQKQIVNVHGYEPTWSGDVYIPPQEMSEWVRDRSSGGLKADPAREIIAERAYQRLRAGHVVNIGIGAPEHVAVAAAREGLLSEITLTVESGAIGGLPASGGSFGATIGADTIYDMSQQFDFYDGGGLDICFLGALEIDAEGNVNGHCSPGKIVGIGGFANIAQATRNVVFCATFTSGGLKIARRGQGIEILSEGKYMKFVEKVNSVSFSSKNALANGQNVYYVTERCTFELTKDGLKLIEVVEGVDIQRDILSKLPFAVKQQ